MNGPIANSDLLVGPDAAYEPTVGAERVPKRGEFVRPAGGHGTGTGKRGKTKSSTKSRMANHEILRLQLQDVVVSPP